MSKEDQDLIDGVCEELDLVAKIDKHLHVPCTVTSEVLESKHDVNKAMLINGVWRI